MLKRIPETALHALCAAFVAIVTRIGLPHHRVWAWWAVCACSATAALTLPRPGARPAAVRSVTLGALVGPLALLAVGLLVRDDDQRPGEGRSRTDVATPAR
ncbi:hypothetical protein [Saccharothrix xinjiangensis]|uniref:Uncharacterized protein n=1 Tax=Saccharothrix xinjiangensis TaxID=204798 RepID=A0ABV9Y416_9PSEU